MKCRSQKTGVRRKAKQKEQNSERSTETRREKTGGRKPGGRDKGRGRGSVHRDQGECKKDKRIKYRECHCPKADHQRGSGWWEA
jgi:hypothetical protein